MVQGSVADVQGDDLYSEVSVDRGYFTSGTSTTRRIVALSEGPLVVLDTLHPDVHANGWSGGPSWAVVTGLGIGDQRWPAEWARPNLTEVGPSWFNFVGFA